FQPVDWVNCKIFERGVTGSKIINCDSYARFPQTVESVTVLLCHLHQHDFEAAGLYAPSCQAGSDVNLQLGRPFELDAGNVHGEDRRRDILIVPPLELATSLLEHPPSER